MVDGRPSTHACPGGCGRQVPRNRFACGGCWRRLPAALKHSITDNYRRDAGAHLAAMSAACDWYRRHREASASEERCLHELLPGQCAFCLGKQGPEEESLELRARLLDSGDWFAAQYKGRCDGCSTPFPVGAAIQMAAWGWRAECCAEEGGGTRD